MAAQLEKPPIPAQFPGSVPRAPKCCVVCLTKIWEDPGWEVVVKLFLSLFIVGAVAGCSSSGSAGDTCDVASTNACDEGLVCAAASDGEARCQVPVGGMCDPEADMAWCEGDAVCVSMTDDMGNTTGTCYLPEGAACDPAEDGCDPALRCVQLVDMSYACERPLEIRGLVRDATDSSPIEGAQVIALDDLPVAVTDVAVSDAMGNYVLELPTLRNMDGSPVDAAYTLRSSADGYQTFPGGIRTALPINTSETVEMDDAWVIQGTLTEIVLIPLEDLTTPRATISGHVVAEGREAGVLVVAEGDGGAFSSISDLGGAYTIFNVTDGAYEVRGYAADLQLTPADVTVAGAPLEGVDLVDSMAETNTLTGTIQIVNASADLRTSVVLVVESTFDEVLGRGSLPPGLRAPRDGPPDVQSGWTIEGIPDGRYVVLAGFENDGLVRDPDQLIAGTAIVTVELPGPDGPMVTLTDSFKVTEALDVVGPGRDLPEAVTAPPTLEWADDSSEEYYQVQVFNAYGDVVWEMMVPGVSGMDTVTVDYAGPMTPGMYYQFRATSFRMPGGGTATAISATEDLRGVFFVDG